MGLGVLEAVIQGGVFDEECVFFQFVVVQLDYSIEDHWDYKDEEQDTDREDDVESGPPLIFAMWIKCCKTNKAS